MLAFRLTLKVTREAAGLGRCCRRGALRGFVNCNDSLGSA
jgi:hypothetical protein